MADPTETHTDPSNPAEGPPETAQQPPHSDATTPTWPGWPGDNVFRLIVPVVKVGSIIGRKGELIKKICEETRARVRVLEAPVGTADRVVLISGKEEADAPLSPAMDAVIRVFKRVTGLGEGGDSATDAAAFCSIRLLVASTQAITLIGKQGSTIKSIQENSGAVVRILPQGELPSYATSDERIAEIHGEAFKVHKALEAVLGHLRKFLHDRSVVAVFEKTYNETISQDQTSAALADKTQSLPHTTQSLVHTTQSQTLLGDHSLSLKRDSYFDRDFDMESKLRHSALSLYGSDPALGGLHSSGLTRAAAPMVTQITQTMQVPLSYAEDIIGIAGRNIAYIRRASGASLTVQESQSGGVDEITVEIKGTASQIQTAQQLIQESVTNHKGTSGGSSMYGKSSEMGLSSAYSQLPDTTYRSSSYSGLGGGYSSSGLGGYSSYRF